MKRVGILLTSLFVFGSAHADLSLEVFRKLSKGSQLDKTSVEMYVGGVAKGYLHANGYLAATKQPLLFCHRGDLTTGTALELTTSAVNEHLLKAPGDLKKEMVELLLLMKLKQLFPC